jgi:2-hydroxychromene-2-carboxylate isomerase
MIHITFALARPCAALIGGRRRAVRRAARPQTSEAADRGVCGSPSFFVRDEMFFGSDRLDFVIEAAKVKT